MWYSNFKAWVSPSLTWSRGPVHGVYSFAKCLLLILHRGRQSLKISSPTHPTHRGFSDACNRNMNNRWDQTIRLFEMKRSLQHVTWRNVVVLQSYIWLSGKLILWQGKSLEPNQYGHFFAPSTSHLHLDRWRPRSPQKIQRAHRRPAQGQKQSVDWDPLKWTTIRTFASCRGFRAKKLTWAS